MTLFDPRTPLEALKVLEWSSWEGCEGYTMGGPPMHMLPFLSSDKARS